MPFKQNKEGTEMKITRQQKTTLRKLKEAAKEGKISESSLDDVLLFFGTVLNSSEKIEEQTKDIDLVFQFLVAGEASFYIIIEEGEISAKRGDFQFGDVLIEITEKAVLTRVLSQKSTLTKEYEKEKVILKQPPKSEKMNMSGTKIIEILSMLFTEFFKKLEEIEIK